MPTRLRVLLIDDNPDDRALVLREVRHAFPDVEATAITESRDLDEALNRGGFDLAITDYQLRWTDGIEVLRAIKDQYPDCPVIMCTATGSEEIAVEAMKNRLDDYVIKNVHHLVRLRAAVTSVLQQAETRRRAIKLQTRLDSLLTQLNVGIFRCTQQGELLEANEAFLNLLGLRSIENARTIEDAKNFLRQEVCIQLVDDLLKTGQPQEKEVSLADADGNSRWMRLCGTLTTSPAGETVIDGLLEDITERKQTEEEAGARIAATARLALLSPRESEVMELVVAGKASKIIARQLEICEKTVEKHRTNITKKLHVQSVADLVRLALTAKPTR